MTTLPEDYPQIGEAGVKKVPDSTIKHVKSNQCTLEGGTPAPGTAREKAGKARPKIGGEIASNPAVADRPQAIRECVAPH